MQEAHESLQEVWKHNNLILLIRILSTFEIIFYLILS